jgi:DNA-directed RNA polymerase
MKITKDMTQAELETELVALSKEKLQGSVAMLSNLKNIGGRFIIEELEMVEKKSLYRNIDESIVKTFTGASDEEGKWRFLQLIVVLLIDLLYHSNQTFGNYTKITHALMSKMKSYYLAERYKNVFESKAKTLIASRRAVGWSDERINSMMTTQAKKQGLLAGFTDDELFNSVSVCIRLISDTGILQHKPAGHQKVVFIIAPEIVDALDKAESKMLDNTSTERAMIEEPIPYNEEGYGGFHTSMLQALNPVHTPANKRIPLKDKSCLERYINTINYIQKTQWTLNKPIYNLFNKLLSNLDDLQKYRHIFFDVHPYVKVTNDMLVGDKKRYNQDNQKAERVLMTMTYLLREAKIYEDVNTLWFTWFIDYRGRFYPRAGMLSPQGTKQSKALLQFKRGGRLLSPRHVDLFKMEVVKSFGFDKLPLPERLEKFKELEPFIINIAEAVLNCDYPPHGDMWGGRSESLQCLAYCVEWYKIRKNPLGALVHLPVTIDGTCNGLQHIGAIMRDKGLGSTVNLVDSDKPADIYMEAVYVAKRNLHLLRPEQKALKYLAKENKEGDKQRLKELTIQLQQVKDFWLGQEIHRKLTKTAVMTIPYSSTAQRRREKILIMVSQHGYPIPKDSNGKELVIYKDVLIDCIMEAVDTVTVTANTFQKYVQKYLRDMIKQSEDSPDIDPFVLLNSPFGLPLYNKVSLALIIKKMQLGTRYIRFYGFPTKDKKKKVISVDSRKSQSSCSPNLIHSYDSCHLVMTMEQFEFDNGDQDVWLVHDSYGCLPSYMDNLAYNTRACFVKLHQEYPLNVCLRYPYKLFQTTDTLDLKDVQKSTYFFH